MPQQYVARFVALESGVGKTRVAGEVVKELKTRGYRLGVIKHCSSGVSLEVKDTSKYIANGADVVVATSPGLAVVYLPGFSELLEAALSLVNAPIVIVEGYRGSSLGEAVLVARGEEDLRELLKIVSNPVAAVTHTTVANPPENMVLFRVGEERELAKYLEDRALEFFHQQTPRRDCGYCGYASCRELVLAYLKGYSNWCPVVSGVEVFVNGFSVPLNPFVKNIVKSTIDGMLRALKGVPRDYKKVTIQVSD